MKTAPTNCLLASILFCCFIIAPAQAEEPSPGPGHGRGQGQGGGKGGGPGGGGGFQEAIHKLFDNHEKIKRTVEMTDSGYKAKTVSDDPEIAKTLQKHVKEMRERLGAGMMIRRWDPAFAELVEHYKDIDHDFKEIDGGVELVAKGKTPDAVKVVQNHAKIISGFVKLGSDEMHESHPRALGDAKKPADSAKADKTAEPACPKCDGTLKPGTACPKCEGHGKPASEATQKATPPSK
jgi:uncharacterized protein YdcH (DUF465 family)